MKVYLPEEVNLCSLVTAMADEEANDGVELEAQGELAHPPDKSDGLDHLTEEQREQLLQLLDEYKDIFQDVPGPANFEPYHLDTGESRPVSQAPYRPGLNWKERVKEEVDKLLKAGFVRPSSSPWSSPVIPVPKKDGGVRLVVDYRAINKLTQVDRYPVPRLDELLAQVGKSKFLSTLDLSQGYHQVPLVYRRQRSLRHLASSNMCDSPLVLSMHQPISRG